MIDIEIKTMRVTMSKHWEETTNISEGKTVHDQMVQTIWVMKENVINVWVGYE